MAVPTRGDFSAYFALAEAPIQASVTLQEVFTEQDVIDYLIDAELGQQRRFEEVRGTAVYAWLTSQREFQRAERLAFRQPRKFHPLLRDYDARISLEDRVRARAREIVQATTPVGGEPVDAWRARSRLERAKRNRFVHGWLHQCIRALAEYYDGSAGRELPELSRQVEQAHREAREAVRRYHTLAARLNSLELLGVRAPGAFREFTATPDLSGMPLRRREQHACERLFVYRMEKANRAVWISGPPRADAIAELMNLEGFRHQYDTRTIERLCAEFRKLSRQLAERNRGLLAGAAAADESEGKSRGT